MPDYDLAERAMHPVVFPAVRLAQGPAGQVWLVCPFGADTLGRLLRCLLPDTAWQKDQLALCAPYISKVWRLIV